MKTKQITLALVLMILVLCLSACSNNAPDPVVGDHALLEFPGVEWNMTPEEVKTNLGLSAKQILVDAQGQCSEYMDTWVLTATDIQLFGEEIAQAQFHFVKYTGYDHFGLDSVRVYYPDEVDMAAVREVMIEIYGEGSERGITRYHISNNKVVSSLDDKLCADTPDALLYCWVNSCKGTDVLSKEIQEAVIDLHTADREIVLESLDQNPLVTLYCTDSAGEGNLSDDDLITCNHVNFLAGTYIDLIQRFGK